MKKLDEMQVFRKDLMERDHRLAVMGMIRQQIEVVEGIMERHKELVQSPLNYNMCVGLFEQLKSHSHAAFDTGVAAATMIPDGVSAPYFEFKDR